MMWEKRLGLTPVSQVLSMNWPSQELAPREYPPPQEVNLAVTSPTEVREKVTGMLSEEIISERKYSRITNGEPTYKKVNGRENPEQALYVYQLGMGTSEVSTSLVYVTGELHLRVVYKHLRVLQTPLGGISFRPLYIRRRKS